MPRSCSQHPKLPDPRAAASLNAALGPWTSPQGHHRPEPQMCAGTLCPTLVHTHCEKTGNSNRENHVCFWGGPWLEEAKSPLPGGQNLLQEGRSAEAVTRTHWA